MQLPQKYVLLVGLIFYLQHLAFCALSEKKLLHFQGFLFSLFFASINSKACLPASTTTTTTTIQVYIQLLAAAHRIPLMLQQPTSKEDLFRPMLLLLKGSENLVPLFRPLLLFQANACVIMHSTLKWPSFILFLASQTFFYKHCTFP